jgi:hypothetical protein
MVVTPVVDARKGAKIISLTLMLHNEHPKHLSLMRIHFWSAVTMRNHLLRHYLTQRVRLIAEGVGKLLRRWDALGFGWKRMEQGDS